MSKKQEYLYNGKYVTIWREVADEPEFVVVTDDGNYGELFVVRKSHLIEKEKSNQWLRAQERANELRLITAKAEENFDAVVEKVIEKSIKSLQMRMKLNMVFNKDMDNNSGWAMLILNELENLIKENAKDVVTKQ